MSIAIVVPLQKCLLREQCQQFDRDITVLRAQVKHRAHHGAERDARRANGQDRTARLLRLTYTIWKVKRPLQEIRAAERSGR
jgi:hypothetical protein